VDINNALTEIIGKPVSIGFFRDITERKLVEDQLRLAEQQSRAWVEHSPVCTKMLDIDFNLQYMSSAGIIGLNIDDVTQYYGKPYPFDFFPEAFRNSMNKNLELARKTGEILTLEAPVVDTGGNEIWFHQTAVPVKDKNGQIIYFIIASMDTTKRKQVEEALRESEQQSRAFLEHSPACTKKVDLDFNLQYMSSAGIEALNIEDITEYYGKPYPFEFYPDSFRNTMIGNLERVKETGEVIAQEASVVDVDGRELWFHSTLVPVNDEDGQIEYIIVVSIETTERKRAEQELLKQKSFLQKAQEIGRIGTWELDIAKNLLLWTDENYRIFGLPIGTELTFEIFLDCIHPNDREYVDTEWTAALHGKPYDIEHRLLVDGKVKWVRERAELEFDVKGKCLRGTGVTQDITERKIADEALRTSEALVKAVLDNLPIGIAVNSVDSGVVFEYMNDLFPQCYRTTSEALADPDAFWDSVCEDSEFREEIKRKVIDDCACGDPARMHWEDVPISRKGEETTFISARNIPVPEKQLVISTVWDVTDRIKAEEERRSLESQVQHSQKLESLGVLAGGIAHDFNNILMTILGNIGMAIDDLSEVSPIRPFLDEVETGAKRAADLTHQMLAYSGKGDFIRRVIDISELVGEMSHLIESSVSKNARTHLKMDSGTPPIEADVAQMQQIVMNLITNASEAIDASDFTEGEIGSITISTGLKECDNAYLSKNIIPDIPPEGEYAFLEVADNGCGMDEETLAKVFEPFFSTKFTGRGLGMSAVLGIVRGHEGAIIVDSNIGEGSRFTVLFPACEDGTLPTGERQPVAEPLRGHGTVLIVDDEPQVLRLAKKMVERAGFDVLIAEDGVECVDIFRKHQDDITCVILDLTMPKMDGIRAHKAIMEIRSDTVVLIASGYNESSIREKFGESQPAGFVQKPYSREQLNEKIRDVLGMD